MNIEYQHIKDEQEYELIMAEILDLMNKGEANLSLDESEQIRTMALAAQAYEKEHFDIEPVKTSQGMKELHVYEMKFNQKDVAGTPCINVSDISFTSGKLKSNIPFIESTPEQLKVPADSL